MLRIRDVLPRIFHKAYPVVDPKTEMLSAMSLLRFHEIDVLPLSFETGTTKQKRQQRGVFGFSSLARLMLLKPKELGRFLELPCQAASEPLASVSADGSLSSVLNVFAKTRFGFARVEDRRNVGALVSLSDVLGLYETAAIATDLAVKDVGSSVISTPPETSLRKALQVMFERRHRRMFVSGKKEFISDRGIIGHVFSPAILSGALQDTKDVLDIPVSAVEKMTPKDVQPDMPLREAAKLLKAEKAGQCLVFDGKVVTPWDIVMRPWKAKALKISRA